MDLILLFACIIGLAYLVQSESSSSALEYWTDLEDEYDIDDELDNLADRDDWFEDSPARGLWDPTSIYYSSLHDDQSTACHSDATQSPFSDD